MKVNYNVTGADRKELVMTVSSALMIEPVYKGVPSCAYAVGNFTITKDGALEWDERASDEEAKRVKDFLKEHGYEGEADEDSNEEAGAEGESEAGAEAQEEAGRETAGESDAETDETEASDQEPTELSIEMPRSFYTDEALSNLRKIVDSKANLIKKSVGAEELPINVGDEKVAFPWFTAGGADETKAYSDLIARLSAMAKDAKRVTAKEKEVESEAYAFRCFLLRLGMSGNEYKATRRVLMRNLDGPSAFPNKAAADAFAARQKEKRDAARAETAAAGEED